MPGLASADPHTLPTLSISRMNGQQRGGNMEQVHSMELSRLEQNRNAPPCKGFPPHFDARAAEESLSTYCKPVELYNIIQRRAQRNPFFLQRCLSYKMEAAHQRRIKLNIAVVKVSAMPCDIRPSAAKPNGKCAESGNDLPEQLFQSVLVMLTSPVSMHSSGYHGFRLSQTRALKAISENFSSTEKGGQSSITFLLPEVRKLLLNAKRDGAVILFITSADLNPGCDGSRTHIESSVNSRQPVLWGSVSLATLCQNWLSPSNSNGHANGTTADISEGLLRLDLFPSKLQLVNSVDGRCVKLQSASLGGIGKSRASLQLRISGEEAGRNAEKASCVAGSLFSNWKILSFTSLSQSRRLQPGQVAFHYYYYFNQLYKSEVTENYSCPFCVVCCSSLKGLRCHLLSTHDLFSFEFLATSDYRLVNVYCRNDVLGPEGNVRDIDGLLDARLKNFVFRSRSGRRRKPVLDTASIGLLHVDGHVAEGNKRNLEGKDGGILPQPVISIGLKSKSLTPEQGPPVHIHVQQHSLSLQGSGLDSTKRAPTTTPQCISVNVQPAVSVSILQEQSRKRERSEDQVQFSKVDGNLAQGFKRQLSEKIAFSENILESSMEQALANMGANGVCLAIAAPMPSQERRPQPTPRPQTVPSISKAEKNRKNLVERSEARTRSQLQKRQFYHSHTAQPMVLEQLLSDRDSEDEVDDAIADLEDRRMLNDFVDVTHDEKEVMHMWNSFVRKQRVLADGHCPWACEAFAKFHARKFFERPALRRCLMLFLIKLWNHHLVDANTVNRSLSAIELYEQTQGT